MENRIEEATQLDSTLQCSRPASLTKEWFDSVLRATGSGVIVTDAGGCVQFVNDAAERLIGMPRAAAEGSSLKEVLRLSHRDGSPVSGDLVKLATVSDVPVSLGHDLLLEPRQGATRQIEGEIAVRRESGRPVGAVLTFRDVTIRKTEELQRYEEQKMRTVAQLAGTIAHELNNLVLIISGHAEALEEEYAELEPVRSATESIQGASRKIAKMMRQLLTLSHREVLQPKPVSLDMVIEQALPKLRATLPDNIGISADLHAEGATLLADPGQMEQAILDLIGHCRDRMPKGGRLEIATRRIVVDESLRGRHLQRFVELTVTDTGPSLRGVPVETLFEPSWVTAPGRPPGLGLFALRTLVGAACGHLAVESDAETGVQFVLRLPEIEEETLAAPAPSPQEADKLTVLLVEDDNGVRVLLHNALAKRGYRVLEARDGQEALMQAEIYDGAIDLLITDVVMPNMGGPELAHELIEARPDTKLLLISGAPDDVGDVQELVKLGAHFMLKPFSQRELAARVDAVLNGEANS